MRRRIRGKLSRIDPAYDVDDVLASTRRRLDLALLRGMFRPKSEGEAAMYLRRAADRVAFDVNRAARRRRKREKLVARFYLVPRQIGDVAENAGGVVQELAQKERDAFYLWLRGWSHASIARELGITVAAYRGLRDRTRKRFASTANEDVISC